MGASSSLPCIPGRRRGSQIEPTARRLHSRDGLLSSSGSCHRSDESEDEDDETTSQRLMAWAPPLDAEAKLRGTSSLVRWPTEDRSSFSENFAAPNIAVASRVTPPRRSGSHERPVWSSSSNSSRRLTRENSNMDQSPSGWTVAVPEEESDEVGCTDSDSPTSRGTADEMEVVEAVAEPVAVLLTRTRLDDNRTPTPARLQSAALPPYVNHPIEPVTPSEQVSPTTVATPDCNEPTLDHYSIKGAGPELASALGSRLNRLRGGPTSDSTHTAHQTALESSKVEFPSALNETIRDGTDTGDGITAAVPAPAEAAADLSTESGSDTSATIGPASINSTGSSSAVVECSTLEQHLDAAATPAQPHRLSEKVARLFGTHNRSPSRNGSSTERELREGVSTAHTGQEVNQRARSPSTASGTTKEARAAVSSPSVSVGSSSEALKVRWRSVYARFDHFGNGVVSVDELEKGVADSPVLARELGLPSNVSTEGATSLRYALLSERRMRVSEVKIPSCAPKQSSAISAQQ